MRAVDIITAKRDGQELTTAEIDWLISSLTRGEIPDYQMAAWLMAVYFRGMSSRETADLTRSMVASGRHLDLSAIGAFVADKHSTGGVGDKTTLVLAPLVAAAGVPMAKMSGRGLGYSGGTLDKLESIKGFRCELSIDEFVEGVKRIGLVVASQTPDMAPADGKLYALRDVTGTVESLPLIASSIMSKKIAAGANGVVLDVKVGRGAFMKTMDDARALAVAMRNIGESVGLKVRAVLSGMDQPLGFAVGNALEVREAVETLKGEGPQDLLEVVYIIGANLLEMAGKVRSLEEGAEMLRARLESGAGLAKFIEFIENQGGDPAFVDNIALLPTAPVQTDLLSVERGYLAALDAETIGKASVEIGAGRRKKGEQIDHAVGFVLRAKLGDRVDIGQSLATIHAAREQSADESKAALMEAFRIVPDPFQPPPVVIDVVA
ncbi:MAG: thymidine phosphorylase [Chloroflexota bacterium]